MGTHLRPAAVALVAFAVAMAPLVLGAPSEGAEVEYQFADVTDAAGVADAVHPHFGATWSDYDADGFIDLYVVNGQGEPHGVDDENVLYRNNGDGTFTDTTVETNAADPYVAMRNIWADYDRDGDLDFYSHNFVQSTLYQNNGNVFSDVNEASGAGLEMAKGTGAAWGDYDNDGWLDIHATSFPGFNALLHNNGDGTFTDLQASSGMSYEASGMGNVWGDYDLDGDIDMAITAVTRDDPVFLYENNGDGTFYDATAEVGIVVEAGSSNAAVNWADYDNDGDWDLHITEVTAGSVKTLPNRMYLFQNQGDNTFIDATSAAGLMPTTMNNFWDAAFADFDNDGDIDLYVAGDGPDIFYLNNGDGTFTDVASEVGVNIPETTWGIIWGDYDNDGDADMYVVLEGDAAPNHLLQNQGGSNNWLQLDLRGTVSNLDAIGARITVVANGQIQMREITGGSGFFSQHSLVQQFGLGTSTTIESIEIVWPSGVVQDVSGLAINERHMIVEPDMGRPTASFTADPGVAPLDVDFDGSASFDDGVIVSYDWDFGDGDFGNGVAITHSYAAAGSYLVTLEVTDDEGMTDTASRTVVVTEPGGDLSMHVGDLGGSAVSGSRGRWNGVAAITMHDIDHNPVADATVSGNWTAGNVRPGSCVTDATGTCTITRTDIRGTTTSATFELTGVTHGSFTFDSASNHDPDADSDGTTIVVTPAVGDSPTASFTSSCLATSCDFLDTSSDPDGTVVAWLWDFGDLATSTVQNPSHNYAAAGTYSVTLIVTDNGGATGSTNANVVVTDTGSSGTMHVSDLDGTSVDDVGGVWLATVTVAVVDDAGAPVDGVEVTGEWRNGEIGTCTSDVNGICDMDLLTRGRRTSLKVTALSHASLTYDSSANTDPDGDSDGRFIFVVGP